MMNDGKGKIIRSSDDFYFYRFTNGYPHTAIISGDFKLIKFLKTKKVELYNIKDDIGENIDISLKEPATVKELEEKLMKYTEQVNPVLAKKYL